MINKYYTPSIEEFHVGFECEIEYSWGMQKGTYPFILREDTLTGFTLNKLGETETLKRVISGIRVKYLDEENVKSLGFIVPKQEDQRWLYQADFVKEITDQQVCAIYLNIPNTGITLIDKYDYENFDQLNFNIKNKSELVKLLKMLNL